MTTNDSNETKDASVSADVAATLARRRRFIKLGASSVPVALTLTSRPVMAWHCSSTSAWGSAQMGQATVGSAKTRLDNNITDGNECWTVANWKNNNCTGSNMSTIPWNVVKSKGGYSSVVNAKAGLTIGMIFPNGLLGCNGSTTVWSIVSGNDKFKKSVTVARLNSVYATSYKSQIDSCIISSGNRSDQIQEMARLGSSYASPNAPTIKWSTDDIVAYLNSNWLARTS